jgi:hypothetical protein
VNGIVSRLKRRSDYLDLAYLCSKICCDSYAEVLFILKLLEADATTTVLPISDLGWTPHQVVSPENREEVNRRPQPCLILEEKVFIFQVSFLTPRLHTVDLLIWSEGWSFLEIDAEGHDFTGDRERTDQIALPCLRTKPNEILAPGFGETMKMRLNRNSQRRRAS